MNPPDPEVAMKFAIHSDIQPLCRSSAKDPIGTSGVCGWREVEVARHGYVAFTRTVRALERLGVAINTNPTRLVSPPRSSGATLPLMERRERHRLSPITGTE